MIGRFACAECENTNERHKSTRTTYVTGACAACGSRADMIHTAPAAARCHTSGCWTTSHKGHAHLCSGTARGSARCSRHTSCSSALPWQATPCAGRWRRAATNPRRRSARRRCRSSRPVVCYIAQRIIVRFGDALRRKQKMALHGYNCTTYRCHRRRLVLESDDLAHMTKT
jgi:hypothetical protein